MFNLRFASPELALRRPADAGQARSNHPSFAAANPPVRLLVVVALLSAPLAALQAQAPPAQNAALLDGHTPPQVMDGTAQRAGHYSPEQMLRLVLAIKPPHLAEEEQFLQQLQTKGSPNFHQFLSAEEWDARFAPAAEDEQKVVDWAKSQGLTVTNRFPNRLLVDLEAPAGTVERAFGITINSYKLGEEIDFSNDRDPILPPTLEGIVYSVQGLNSIQRMHGSMPGPELNRGADYAPGPVYAETSSGQADGDPSALPSEGLRPLATGSHLDPTDIFNSQEYDYAGLQNLGHCCNPKNVAGGSPPQSSIAIAAFGSFLSSDMTGFQKQYPYLANNWTSYSIDGAVTCPKGQTSCPSEETTMDMEWSMATSNSFGSVNSTAHVYVYIGANTNYSTFTDLYNRMLKDGHARVMTTSWGGTEVSAFTSSAMDAQHAIFNAMIGQGWTLIASSGDRGASDDCKSNSPAHTSVEFPGSDPDFVSAGGTELEVHQNLTFASEVAWQGGTTAGSCKSNNGGSGGGVSAYYKQPSWQKGLGGTMRLVPDISLNALGVNQNIYFNGKLVGQGNGTSIVAPELAGFFAQENAYLLSIGSKCGAKGKSACSPIGAPNFFLYEEGMKTNAAHNPFYDILTGCNSNDVTATDKLTFYCAAKGYDKVTGWGSANMLQLAWALNWEVAPANGIPFVYISGPSTNRWYNNNQTVAWQVVDYAGTQNAPGTGIAGFTAAWDAIPSDPATEAHGGAGNSFYSGPLVPNTTTGCLSLASGKGCGAGVSQGCHTAHVRGWNNQGESTLGSVSSGYPETYGPLCYDTLQPVTAISTGTPAANGSVKVTLTAVDPGAAKGTGSGVFQTYYSVDGPSCAIWGLSNCTVYSAPFTLSAAGAHTVRYFSMDLAANTEAVNSLAVTIK